MQAPSTETDPILLRPSRNVPFATVTHRLGQFAKTVGFRLNKMPERLKNKVLQKPSCSARKYYARAGDQFCEGLFGNAKSLMRRQNLHGRQAAGNEDNGRSHLAFLQSAYQLRCPGFHGALESLRLYRAWAEEHAPSSDVSLSTCTHSTPRYLACREPSHTQPVNTSLLGFQVTPAEAFQNTDWLRRPL